eukprot:gnl/MRDRNA2_/MRDRNA2_35403_c0_seq1.p1 gnl/MRDRNA2_/MRDRNA2_35403_c0~~gnl/MRDRNA2_/MRDRNA2_35403_c0_seq1.p1  ORF type:complete len:308 (-),score=98.00 gnl/MRDRNA2_/MRDRNA2_35403_c0_seq1:14-937(-)
MAAGYQSMDWPLSRQEKHLHVHQCSMKELKSLHQEAKELRRGLRSIKEILPHSSSQQPEPKVETSEEDVKDVSLHQVVMEAQEIIADLLPNDHVVSEDSDSDSRCEYEPEDEMDVTVDEPNQEPSEQWNQEPSEQWNIVCGDAAVHVAGKKHHKDEDFNVAADTDTAEDSSFCVTEPAAEPPAEPAAEPPAAEPATQSQRERVAAVAENVDTIDDVSAGSGADANAKPSVPESASLRDLPGLVPYFEEISEPSAELQADRATAASEVTVASVDGADSDANPPSASGAASLRNIQGLIPFFGEFLESW